MTGFRVVGGSNHASTRTYIRQIDQTTYEEKEYRFPLKDGSVAKGYDFSFDSPQSSTKIIFGGEQGIFTIELYYIGTTDFKGVKIAPNHKTEDVAVYDLSGRKVADRLTEGHNLQKGVYIVNGKKVIIK